MKKLVITAGEPAGIGPDLAVMLSQYDWQDQLIVIADPQLIEARAKQLNLPLQIHLWQSENQPQASQKGSMFVLPISLAVPCKTGELAAQNAHYVLASLQAAIDGIHQQHFDALITGPVHKGIINDAGIPFTGHTEWFAEQAGNCPVVMMLACDQLRVALATTHIPIRELADAITVDSLTQTLDILYHSLQQDFGISTPHILVAGLNPHAGEGGHLGREDLDVILPVCRDAQAKGWKVSDPLPADTLFSPSNLAKADAVLSMFHDQGLPVLKHLGFGQAVNVTLGLPYIRTSVDHGTALDLAGTGKAEIGSFIYAIKTAISMVEHRHAEQRNTNDESA